MIEDENGAKRGHRYRLAWKYRASGAMGTGPWMHDLDTVEAWLESLSKRYQDRVDHWVETEPAESWR